MSLVKLAGPTLLADQVYANIRQAILDGELEAGARLRVRDLAEQVGTSVMPVREAIRRLEEAGLAQREPHKGAVVRGLSLEELLDVYAVRLLVEREAAGLGAARISAAGCDRMTGELWAMRAAVADGDVIGFLDHDEALLTTLYTAAGNPVLLRTITTLWQRCRAYKVVGSRGLSATNSDAMTQHQAALVQAARNADGATAAAVTEASLDEATRRVEAELSGRRKPGASSPARTGRAPGDRDGAMT